MSLQASQDLHLQPKARVPKKITRKMPRALPKMPNLLLKVVNLQLRVVKPPKRMPVQDPNPEPKRMPNLPKKVKENHRTSL